MIRSLIGYVKDTDRALKMPYLSYSLSVIQLSDHLHLQTEYLNLPPPIFLKLSEL